MANLSDQERQEDEILVLQNIFNVDEFKHIKRNNIECSFSISSELVNENLLVKYSSHMIGEKMYIKFLPPVRLYVQLPHNYPSQKPPAYFLAVNWLPPWHVSLICQKLDELWQENQHNEILFNWLEFLKNELLTYLNVEDTLDISYLYNLFLNPTNQFLLEVIKWSDDRVIYGGLDLNPIERLLDFNEFSELFDFESNNQDCGICFLTYPGKMCMRVNLCKHIFCKDCVRQFLKLKIDEKNVLNINCPAFKCKTILKSNEIKEICSSDLLQKYEKYLEEIKLLTNRKNMVYCPRRMCQTSVIVEAGENLASCPNCEYNFCPYCLKVYHGVMACDMNSEDKLKLIKEYVNGNNISKKFLEKKYGKHQIQQIVEKQLTNDFLKENTKICPTCGIYTIKSYGCNLITCYQCFTNFCWLCNAKIISEDPYDHFKSFATGPCSNRLFEGIDESNEIDDEANYFDIENFDLFMIEDFE